MNQDTGWDKAFVCRFCGDRKLMHSPGNPNICFDCTHVDLDDLTEPAGATSIDPAQLGKSTRPVPEPPSELSYFLELESPSVMECFKAVEQAKQAIAQAGAQERAQSARRERAVARPG